MDPYTLDQLDSSEPQGFHAIMRFLRVINRRRMILICLVAVAAFVATVRHNRIPKEYQASAKLMIRQVTADPKMLSSRATEGLLASYRQLLLSDTVLGDTAKELRKKPPELAALSDTSLWPIKLRSMLTVSFETDEHVLEIKCRSTDPDSTVAVIQALTVASSRFMDDYQKDISFELMTQLESNLSSVREKLESKERDLLQARRDCGDIAINAGSKESHPLVQRVSHLNGELTTVRSKRLELQSALASAERLTATNSDLTSAVQKLESIVGAKVMSRLPGTGSINTETVEKLEAELKLMETELVGLRPHYGSGHAEVVRRRAQIQAQSMRVNEARSELQRQVSVGIRDPRVGRWLLDTINAELMATSQYESSLEQEYTQVERDALLLSDKLASIQVAEREVETLRETHTSLLNRLNSTNLENSGGTFKVAALSDPRVPSAPVYPVLGTVLVLFCIVAAAIGIAIIYVLDLLDDRLRSPEEVREELGLPVLGIIRRLPEEEAEQSKIYVHAFPHTPQAECFRILKTSLTLSPMETKCLVITSTEASEGKTTMTVNLAASYAQTGQRTLLIDADMRRPGLSRLLEVRGHGGLSEVLRAVSDIPAMCRERIVKTEVPLLEVLPCGPRMLNAGMLLSMPALTEILDWAVAEYDQVIVDCPPTLPVSDAAIVARYADGIVFLMNPDKTHRRSVARAVDNLRSMGLKIVGIVANTSLSEDSSSYGYQYGYGYASEYNYGHEDELDDHTSDEFDDEAPRRAA